MNRFAGTAETVNRLLSWRVVTAISLASIALVWSFLTRPFPAPGDVPIVDLIEFEDPGFYAVIRTWHLVTPSVMAFIAVMVVTSSYRLWFGSRSRDRRFGRGTLPRWPTSPDDDAPSLVVGECHHPSEPREIRRPSWLTLPERGLYTGVAIFGAVGTGKTSACMRPFARQLLSWQSADPQKRAAALVLEVKGDFCHDIRVDLEDAGRGDDYVELALGGRWQWNPLATAMDSYSLAYTVASLLNQLFGKSKEPFWQQAYTNLIRWLIELHRALPEQWVTFRDLYHCAIDPKRIGQKIEQARKLDGPPPAFFIIAPRLAVSRHSKAGLLNYRWDPAGGEGPTQRVRTPYDKTLLDTLASLGIQASVEEHSRPPSEHAQRVAARGARPLRPTAASTWRNADCRQWPPAAPPPTPSTHRVGQGHRPQRASRRKPGPGPHVGVLLKNAWLQTLLTRPAQIKLHPNRYFRPAVFLCDEYQSFASVGEDDPSGDEKAFALTRQSRVIPIVATQSISSLKSVLSGQDAWRTLPADPPDQGLPLPQRRKQRRTGLQHVRQGPPALPLLLLHRVRQARLLGHHRPRRRRERHPRNLEVLPRATGAPLPPSQLLPPGELPGDHPPLRRDQRPGRHPGLPQAPLPPARPPLLARAGGRRVVSIRISTNHLLRRYPHPVRSDHPRRRYYPGSVVVKFQKTGFLRLRARHGPA